MGLSLKPLIAAAALAAFAAGGLAVHSTDAAAAGQRARTSVSLNTSPKPFGYVKSPRPKACSEGRRIAIYEQLGANQRPRSDRRIATAVAYRYHGSFQWQTKSVEAAELYARANPVPGCTGARSKTVSTPAPGAGGTWGTCPNPDPAGHSCILPEVHLDTRSCPSFGAAHGDCDGNTWIKRLTADDDLLWQTCCGHANFHWNGAADGERGAALYVYDDHGYHPLRGYLEGSVSNPASDRFVIRDAWSTEDPDTHWCTEDVWGRRAGESGGPLRLDFVNGVFGADVYIKGYLVQKGHGCG